MGKLKHNLHFEFSTLAFIDIVFLTLIFVVITFRIEEPKQSILINVPSVSSSTHTLAHAPDNLFIQISRDNLIHHNGKVISLSELESIVLDFKNRDGKKVILECDKSATIEIFSKIISLFATHNITRYSLVVKELQND